MQAVDGNMLTLDEMRNSIIELDKNKFVLQDRTKRLEDEVQPRRLEVIKLSNDRRAQDEELTRTLCRVDTLTKSIADKDACIKCGFKQNINLAYSLASPNTDPLCLH